MAEEQDLTFPDLPVGQWWKLRNFFKSKIPGTVNIEYLMSTLSISESTARNTFRNLGILGIIDSEGKTTERANHWRDDELYSQVCMEILEEIYPQDLRDIAEASKDRNALVSWFKRKTRIGDKAAHKNAAVFEVIHDGDLSNTKESKDIKGLAQPRPRLKKPTVPRPSPEPAIQSRIDVEGGVQVTPEKPELPDTLITPTIHIDIQIHISPDATTDQIEQIFASIAKHLYQPRS